MLQMTDGEGPITSAGIDAALELVSIPKRNEPPKAPPNLDVPDGDTLAKEKVGVELEEAGGAVAAEKVTAEVLKSINPEMLFHRIAHLLILKGFQHEPPREDFSSEHAQNVKVFIAKRGVSSLDEILSKEMDLVFLQRLLHDILDVLDTEKVTMSPLTNSPPTGDSMLECPPQPNLGGAAGLVGAPGVAPLQPPLQPILGDWDIEGPLMGPAFRKSEVGPFFFL